MPRNGAHLVWEATDNEDPVKAARAIKACLVYLADEAFKLQLGFTGHLIGVAAESIQNETLTTEHGLNDADCGA